jgi:hypothetical protein
MGKGYALTLDTSRPRRKIAPGLHSRKAFEFLIRLLTARDRRDGNSRIGLSLRPTGLARYPRECGPTRARKKVSHRTTTTRGDEETSPGHRIGGATRWHLHRNDARVTRVRIDTATKFALKMSAGRRTPVGLVRLDDALRGRVEVELDVFPTRRHVGSRAEFRVLGSRCRYDGKSILQAFELAPTRSVTATSAVCSTRRVVLHSLGTRRVRCSCRQASYSPGTPARR